MVVPLVWIQNKTCREPGLPRLPGNSYLIRVEKVQPWLSVSSDTSALEEALSPHPLMGLMDTDVLQASTVLQGPTMSYPVSLVPSAHYLGLIPAYPVCRVPTVPRQPPWNPLPAQKVTLGPAFPSFSNWISNRAIGSSGTQLCHLAYIQGLYTHCPMRPQLPWLDLPMQWD